MCVCVCGWGNSTPLDLFRILSASTDSATQLVKNMGAGTNVSRLHIGAVTVTSTFLTVSRFSLGKLFLGGNMHVFHVNSSLLVAGSVVSCVIWGTSTCRSQLVVCQSLVLFAQERKMNCQRTIYISIPITKTSKIFIQIFSLVRWFGPPVLLTSES